MKTTLFAAIALSAFIAMPAMAKGPAICKSSVCTDLVAQFNSYTNYCKPLKEEALGDERIRDKLNALSDASITYKQTLAAHPGDEKRVQKALDSAYTMCGFGPSEDDVY